MINNTFTDKWILGSFVFILLFGSACYLWYQHEMSPYIQEASETTELIQQWESPENTPSKTDQTADIAPVNDTLPSISKTSNGITEPEMKNHNSDEKTENLKEQTLKTVTDEPVRVSPFGFGPYPQIPEGFPEPDIFDSLETMGNSDMRKALELQKRLIVEFYRQGISLENVGVSGNADGRVYLNYPDVVYVSWDYWTDEDGITHKYAGVARGHPDAMSISKPFLDKGKIPPDITVYELPDGYIDAYELLGLAR